MRGRTWLTRVSVGMLALTGMLAAAPLTGSAQQDATPPPAQTDSQTAGEDDQASGPAVVDILLQPSIDLNQAQEIALEGQADAVVTEVSLGGEDGGLVYRIELDNGIEVDVDASSGEVLRTEQHDDENGNDESENENGADEEEDEEEIGSGSRASP